MPSLSEVVGNKPKYQGRDTGRADAQNGFHLNPQVTKSFSNAKPGTRPGFDSGMFYPIETMAPRWWSQPALNLRLPTL